MGGAAIQAPGQDLYNRMIVVCLGLATQAGCEYV